MIAATIPRTGQRIVGGVAVLAAGALLALAGGIAGTVFAITAAVAWLFAPPVFAFVLAQAGVAALATQLPTPIIAATELTLLVVLLTDPKLPLTLRPRAAAIVATATVVAIAWVVHPVPSWVTATLVLSGIAAITYAVHRYQLVSTTKLTP